VVERHIFRKGHDHRGVFRRKMHSATI
jgi:hypothetical protein